MKDHYLGVDIGSTWTKAVVIDHLGEPVSRALVRTGISFEGAAAASREEALRLANLPPEALAYTISTGYGRRNAPFADSHRTEIACHARGAHHHFPNAMTVVDIGGQDNKIITVGAGGEVEHFLMNRKCAAGTGAFIEEIVRRLDIDLSTVEKLAEAADRDITLSSFCTVFSATEVIKLIREGEKPENICRGIFNSVIARITEMGQLTTSIVLTGGVAAAFPIVATIMRDKTGLPVNVPPHAQFIGAYGAALEARSLHPTA